MKQILMPSERDLLLALKDYGANAILYDGSKWRVYREFSSLIKDYESNSVMAEFSVEIFTINRSVIHNINYLLDFIMEKEAPLIKDPIKGKEFDLE